jgi:formylglycine-generating enzyme required for sulfatase activity
MGDTFGDGAKDERPVHQVTLSNFYLGKYEITLDEFRAFVEATGYQTSAEGPDNDEAKKEIMTRFQAPDLTDAERLELHEEFLTYGGAAYWDAEARKWTGYKSVTTWKNPGIEQADSHPVLAISPDDAKQYCNWLSVQEGRPVAYDLESGGIIDKEGNSTTDITKVVGYRLPTEAEWEYAAREGGRNVRFGNGQDIARSSEINFRGDEGEYDYLESDSYASTTTPVGTFPPNALGLYDMSGNAWEWTSDKYAPYSKSEQINPYVTAGGMHAARGGRWGGDAFEARVFHRDPYPHNDRCNNTGFRIARSLD